MTRKTLLIGVLTLIAYQNLLAQQGLADKVRKHGDVEQVVIREFSPVEVSTLVRSASVIARGLIVGMESFVGAGDKIWTNYTVQVLSVQKGRRDLEGQVLTVRRPGGQVSIEGHTVKSFEPDFPPFNVGEEYILFLQPGADGEFEIPYGAQGAFAVEAGNVRQVSTRFGTWNTERGRVRVTEFLDVLAAAGAEK